MGARYDRLPPEILSSCLAAVEPVITSSQAAVERISGIPRPLTLRYAAPEPLSPLISGLACATAIFRAKPPVDSVQTYLNIGTFTGNLISLGRHPLPAVRLEALLALRGIAQQYHTALELFKDDVLEIASAGVVVQSGSGDGFSGEVPRGLISPRDGTPLEKANQQGILLAGDFFRHTRSRSQWEATMVTCFVPGISQSNPLLQSAAFGAIACAASGVLANLDANIFHDLLERIKVTIQSHEASPVRAAACRALAALLETPDDATSPIVLAVQQTAHSLQLGCRDSVLAVRVHAAAALAVAADTLWKACTQGTCPVEEIHKTAEWFLPVAVAVSGDNDKVRASGVLALGGLLACVSLQSTGSQGGADAVAALVDCLECNANRVQWNACSAAAVLLKASKGACPWAGLVKTLEDLAATDGNARTQALARVALGREDSLCR